MGDFVYESVQEGGTKLAHHRHRPRQLGQQNHGVTYGCGGQIGSGRYLLGVVIGGEGEDGGRRIGEQVGLGWGGHSGSDSDDGDGDDSKCADQ